MKRIYKNFRSVFFIICIAVPGLTQASSGINNESSKVKVVYQFNEGAEQASKGFGNILNQFKASPVNSLDIIVVGYGNGAKVFLRNAVNTNGEPFEVLIKHLQSQGVSFRVCTNTLNAMGVGKKDLTEGVVMIPSGVAEIISLQARENYAYFRP